MTTTTSNFDATMAKLGIQTTAQAATNNPATANMGDRSLGQADFLSLMTAQLKNQDPFSPVDNTQMVAQMAQMSSVAGISEMNTTLKAMSDKLGGTTSADALSYVGKTVLTEGDTAYGRTSGGIAGAVELDGAASHVFVQISDAEGRTLKSMDLGAQSQGTVKYDWNGVDSDGNEAGTGPFTVAVTATDSSGTVGSHSLVWAPVESVSMPSSGSPKLNVTGLGAIDPSAVRQAG